MSTDQNKQAPASSPGPADEDEYAAVAAGEPEVPVDGASSAEGVAANCTETAEIPHDLEQLTARAAKADEYLELAQRTKADFENYRKRALRDAAVAQERGVAKLAKELLPAVDNLDRALEAAGRRAPATVARIRTTDRRSCRASSSCTPT